MQQCVRSSYWPPNWRALFRRMFAGGLPLKIHKVAKKRRKKTTFCRRLNSGCRALVTVLQSLISRISVIFPRREERRYPQAPAGVPPDRPRLKRGTQLNSTIPQRALARLVTTHTGNILFTFSQSSATNCLMNRRAMKWSMPQIITEPTTS